jgi:hypothetical protein
MSGRRLGLLGLATSLLTACAVQEAYHTGAHDVLTVLEAEVQQRQTGVAAENCSSVQYRLPVVTPMTVPTTLVGGVVIPAHETYVVLQPGAWVPAEGKAPRGPSASGCRPLPEGW